MVQGNTYHLCGIAHVELLTNAGLVIGHRLVRQVHDLRNFLQRVPSDQQSKDFELAS